MLCISCGDEMRLLRVDRDDMPGMAGRERQTFHCSRCDELETRTVVAEPATPSPKAPQQRDKSTMPATELPDGKAMLQRAIEPVRGPRA
jgi:hypothetical protein